MKEPEIKDIGVVVPYYTNKLTDDEWISLEQCKRILGRYSIILLVPDSMSEADYPSDSPWIIEKVPAGWMQSIATYNEMMMSEEFYKRFSEYWYILIYQLDAFVFSDKLWEFCQYGYDYIGAPWLCGYYYYINPKNCIWRVGNGGFSLRKVDSFLELLKKVKQKTFKNNEDVFFSISDNENFRVAPIEVALKFAFEREVEQCFQLNNQELPFGCHAWKRYNPTFWKPFIEALGYTVGPVFSFEDKELEGVYAWERRRAQYWEEIFDCKLMVAAIYELCGQDKKNFIIWGAGYYGKKMVELFMNLSLPIKFMIDNNPPVDQKLNGILVTKFSDADITENDVIIVAVKNSHEIVCQLENAHYIYHKDFFLLSDIKSVLGRGFEHLIFYETD